MSNKVSFLGAKMKIFTIGFSEKGAEEFFGILKNAGVKTIIDARLNHNLQINGYAKSEDLKFFLERFGIGYKLVEEFAPTKELLEDYKKKIITWEGYKSIFRRILEERKEKIGQLIKDMDLKGACLLCSEDNPNECHRKLVAEFLKENFIKDLEIVHLTKKDFKGYYGRVENLGIKEFSENKLYTIGASKKKAKEFFELLEKVNVRVVIDVRFNHNSQFNGYSKSTDLRFLLRSFGIDYVIFDEFLPTEDLFKRYRDKKISWDEYERALLELLEKREDLIKKRLSNFHIGHACLLGSEENPEKCHRRLIGEFIKERFIKDLEIIHLGGKHGKLRGNNINSSSQ